MAPDKGARRRMGHCSATFGAHDPKIVASLGGQRHNHAFSREISEERGPDRVANRPFSASSKCTRKYNVAAEPGATQVQVRDLPRRIICSPQAVQVRVEHALAVPRLVLVYQRKRGARDAVFAFDAKRTTQRTHQERLAGAQTALQGQQIARSKCPGDGRAQSNRVPSCGQCQLEHQNR
jgi:hypothetical protein